MVAWLGSHLPLSLAPLPTTSNTTIIIWFYRQWTCVCVWYVRGVGSQPEEQAWHKTSKATCIFLH